uniref:Uncharacterized protein n=1 Tax=Daphnia galeata TaxID=27404 RepID=A0A8J2WGP6_9CRUS|nr:unnamed protein product [Daphnia galeata]
MSCQRHNDVCLSVDSNLLDPIKDGGKTRRGKQKQ